MLKIEHNLHTCLGAYLYEQNHFRSNGLLCFVTTKILRGAADASGKYRTITDRILTVNGCLATPDQWSAFDVEWQAYLEGRGFKRDPQTHKYVFHASKFWAFGDKFQLGPKGLTFLEKQRLYRHLIGIIRKHTEYRFGWGISLLDFRAYEKDWTNIRELFGQPGSYVSKRCFDQNEQWATQNGFEPKIDYVFDRGDEFWGEMFSNYRRVLKKRPDEMQIGNLDCGNKAEYSPIQAADIVAWECQRYFRKLTAFHLSGVHTVLPTPRYELNMLGADQPGRAVFRLKAYKHLDDERAKFFDELLKTAEAKAGETLVGSKCNWATVEDFTRFMLDFCKKEGDRGGKKGN